MNALHARMLSLFIALTVIGAVRETLGSGTSFADASLLLGPGEPRRCLPTPAT